METLHLESVQEIGELWHSRHRLQDLFEGVDVLVLGNANEDVVHRLEGGVQHSLVLSVQLNKKNWVNKVEKLR